MKRNSGPDLDGWSGGDPDEEHRFHGLRHDNRARKKEDRENRIHGRRFHKNNGQDVVVSAMTSS